MKVNQENPTEARYPHRLNTLRVNTMKEVVSVLAILDPRITDDHFKSLSKDKQGLFTSGEKKKASKK